MISGFFDCSLRRFSSLYITYLYQAYLKDFAFLKTRTANRIIFSKSYDGIRLPPPWLRWLVIHKVDPDIFIESGRIQVAELILPLLERHGMSIQSMEAVLDFGCGCGRLLRHFPNTPTLQMWGSDYNKCLVRWCQKHLKNCRILINPPLPPLSMDSEKFDFIYARSVFTHFTEKFQNQWLEEMYRLLKPAGLFLITTKGQHAYNWLTAAEKSKYDRDELVVRSESKVGTNACSAFHPLPYIYNKLREHGFEVLERIPAKTHRYMRQDAMLTRKVQLSI